MSISTVALPRTSNESESGRGASEVVGFDLPRIERAVREILLALGLLRQQACAC